MTNFIPGLIRKFLSLKDTPDSYSGQSGKYCRVNAAEDGLELSAGIECDYTTWTHKWTNTIPDGLVDPDYIAWLIDEKNDVIYIPWADSDADFRFGVYNLSDFSVLFQSPDGSDYVYGYCDNTYTRNICLGCGSLSSGAISRSVQTYILLLHDSRTRIEVWRGVRSTPLWSHDITTEVPGDVVGVGGISLSGKYIIVTARNNKKIICYEGS